ncbi:MAG: hypothetical protein AB8B73_13350 [Ekhidna sp.]
MKVFVYLLFVFTISTTNAQSYVDSGIQKYQTGQYEEAIILFDKGYELRDVLTSTSIARVFFYRGISKLELFKVNGENVDTGVTVEGIFTDIDNSVKYENVWPAKLEEVQGELFDILLEKADEIKKTANREKEVGQKIGLLNQRINYLKMASELGSLSSNSLLLGETYKEIGDLYFKSTEDLSKLQIAKKSYEESLLLYEEARYDDPYSKDIITALLEISTRLMDQERIDEYEKLLKLSGG